MKEKESKGDKEELLSPEETERRYRAIQKRVEQSEAGRQWLAENVGIKAVGMEAIAALEDISRIIRGGDKEPEGLSQTKEKPTGLSKGEIVNAVYKELRQTGEQIREFPVKFILAQDEDWHRTDTCYFEGEGVVIETAAGERLALGLGGASGKTWLTSFTQGLIYTKLTQEDDGPRKLSYALRQSLFEQSSGLVSVEGSLFFDGREVPREYAVDVEESQTQFRGRGRLGNVIFVAEEGQKVNSGLRPVISIPAYREEVVPYLVEEIKDRLGIKEPPKLEPSR